MKSKLELASFRVPHGTTDTGRYDAMRRSIVVQSSSSSYSRKDGKKKKQQHDRTTIDLRAVSVQSWSRLCGHVVAFSETTVCPTL